MAKILTSLHGRLVGISATKKLVINGNTVPEMQDSGTLVVRQGAPGTLNATGTLTAALLQTGIVTSTTAAVVTATLDTGTLMDTTFNAGDAPLLAGEGFAWSVINTGPSTFTVTAAAGHTVVGAGAVATATSARFFTRRTAANTYITYRLS